MLIDDDLDGDGRALDLLYRRGGPQGLFRAKIAYVFRQPTVGPANDTGLTAAGAQASRYSKRYRLALVTNARDFVLVDENPDGKPATLRTLSLARGEDELLRRVGKPPAFLRGAGGSLADYLARALSHRMALAEPKDLACLRASYARHRFPPTAAAGSAQQPTSVGLGLEEALGNRLEAKRGRRFCRSTLVQTLFYRHSRTKPTCGDWPCRGDRPTRSSLISETLEVSTQPGPVAIRGRSSRTLRPDRKFPSVRMSAGPHAGPFPQPRIHRCPVCGSQPHHRRPTPHR